MTPFREQQAQGSWWPPVLAIAVLALALRIGFQGLLWPLELSGDEAHYWDWSRRPALSYHTKGPWVSWVIWVGRQLLGDTQLGVRLPAYLANAVATFAAGWLAALLAGGARRAAILGAVALQCVAAYQVSGSLMTVDMQMVAGWLLGTAGAVWALQRARAGRSVAGVLLFAGLCFGQAFLAKYTAALGGLGVLLALWSSPSLRARPDRLRGLLSFLAGHSLGALPVLVWNAINGWPTVAHLLMHLHLEKPATGMGGGFDPRWLLSYVAIAIAAAGPLLFGAAVCAWISARRVRATSDGAAFELQRVLWFSSLGVLGFYLLVSLQAPTEGNWAVGAYAPLCVLASDWLWRSRAQPQGVWRPRLALGLGRCVALRGALTLALVLTLPRTALIVQRAFDALALGIQVPLYRVSGQRAFALAVDQLARAAWIERGLPGDYEDAPVMADYYNRTALLGFYLPHHPRALCASVELGSRPSSYDDFQDTRLPNALLVGRWFVLVGETPERWQEGFEFDSLIALGSATEGRKQRPVLLGRLLSYRDLEKR